MGKSLILFFIVLVLISYSVPSEAVGSGTPVIYTPPRMSGGGGDGEPPGKKVRVELTDVVPDENERQDPYQVLVRLRRVYEQILSAPVQADTQETWLAQFEILYQHYRNFSITLQNPIAPGPREAEFLHTHILRIATARAVLAGLPATLSSPPPRFPAQEPTIPQSIFQIVSQTVRETLSALAGAGFVGDPNNDQRVLSLPPTEPVQPEQQNDGALLGLERSHKKSPKSPKGKAPTTRKRSRE